MVQGDSNPPPRDFQSRLHTRYTIEPSVRISPHLSQRFYSNEAPRRKILVETTSRLGWESNPLTRILQIRTSIVQTPSQINVFKGAKTDSNPHLHRFTAWAIQPIILLAPCKKFIEKSNKVINLPPCLPISPPRYIIMTKDQTRIDTDFHPAVFPFY